MTRLVEKIKDMREAFENFLFDVKEFVADCWWELIHGSTEW